MNWLDLGWLKRDSGWEFHPWGPFSRGYLLSSEQARSALGRMRLIRASMVLVGACALFLYFQFGWRPLAGLLGAGALAEGALTWWVVVRFERTARPLGWEKGFLYLARWLAPKLLTVARIVCLGLTAFFLYLAFRGLTRLGPYLVAAFFVAVQYFLNYLQQVQRVDRA